MLPAMLVLAGVFALLFVVRLATARRGFLTYRWPAIGLAVAALAVALRGALWLAAALLAVSAALWFAGPALFRPRPPPVVAEAPEILEARRVLGIGPAATDGEIRRAYRTLMARAHPDRGGSHAEAARLTAARDVLLKRRG